MLTINFIYTGESKQIRSLKWLSNRNKNRNMFQIITIFKLLFIVNNVYSTLWIHRVMILFISISQIANVCYWNIQNVSAKKTLFKYFRFYYIYWTPQHLIDLNPKLQIVFLWSHEKCKKKTWFLCRLDFPTFSSKGFGAHETFIWELLPKTNFRAVTTRHVVLSTSHGLAKLN